MSDSSQAVTLGITQGIAIWLAVTPKLTDIRDASAKADSVFVADLRHTELVAGTAAIAIGAVGSFMAHSPAPFAASVFTVLLLAALYEFSLVQPGRSAKIYSLPTGQIVTVEEGLQT